MMRATSPWASRNDASSSPRISPKSLSRRSWSRASFVRNSSRACSLSARRVAAAACSLSTRGELREHPIQSPVFPIEQGGGAVEDALGHAHPCGDRRRGRGARRADTHPIRRGQCLGVELDARVLEAIVDLGHLLQQVIVGRRDDAGTVVGEGFERGLGDRGALGGVGADADLVEAHERVGAGRPEDVRQVGHRGGERREALADVLVVADVGDNALYARDERVAQAG